MRLRTVSLWLAFAVLPLTSAVGEARFGPRVGLTVDPDQVHFGAHAVVSLADASLRFHPNFEIGLGDDVTLISMNANLAYRFSPSAWRPFLGGEIGIIRYEADFYDDTDIGVSLVGGFERSSEALFFEARVGLADAPDVKVTVGWVL